MQNGREKRQNTPKSTLVKKNKVPFAVCPHLRSLQLVDYRIDGFMGERLEASIEQWLLPAPLANPGMLDMMRDRDRQPRRELVPWAGEFVGKYLTSAVLTYRLKPDERLKSMIDSIVVQLASYQDADGYLGPYPKSERLIGKALGKLKGKGFDRGGWDGEPLWDIWGHYHLMYGLLLWHQETGHGTALRICRRIGDMLCDRFLDAPERVHDAGAHEMNLSVAHSLAFLHEITGDAKYLRLVHEIEKDWEKPPAGDYLRTALQGLEFWETPKPRWESLHDIQAMAELYFISGEERYKTAFEHIWWSICKGDRHNTGGFSSFEQATGNPYDRRAIELCCTIAWMALSVDMLRLSGESKVADEIELSTYNGMLGSQHPSGRWWTYNTPMDGFRLASPIDCTAFQAYRGTPELNCCSVNGPRGIGMLSQWALMETDDGIAINFYGPMNATLPFKGSQVTIRQETQYPKDGSVRLSVSCSPAKWFSLKIRIPSWSQKTAVRVNGKPVGKIAAGQYCSIERDWGKKTEIEIRFDLSLHFWKGERDCKGETSIYRGPILLTFDPRFNAMDPDDIPVLVAAELKPRVKSWKQWPRPAVLVAVKGKDGRQVNLCDFATAGATGTVCRTWLKVKAPGRCPKFSRDNPLRSYRVEDK